MKSNDIERTLEEILKIDIEASKKENEKSFLKKKYNEEISLKRREIEREYFKEARKKVKIEKEKITLEKNDVVDTINENTEKEVKRLEFLLNNNIEEIKSKIFTKILDNI
ncbi:hypothetical protein QUF55_03850 [Clostridiaceae bacterium HSG29]|nr:hypothetical protein [Clostridiaceae bacterium HSG29]